MPLFKRLAAQVFFGRGSFPNVDLSLSAQVADAAFEQTRM